MFVLTSNRLAPQWGVGDECFAPWDDDRFYNSTVIAMDPDGKFVHIHV